MYVCMYVTVCTHLFKLTPTMCLLKMSLLKYFYRIFFFFFFFFFGLFFFSFLAGVANIDLDPWL